MKNAMDKNQGQGSDQNRPAAPGQAPIDKTSSDGNVNRGEQQRMGGASPGSVGSPEASRSSHGQHGGNHGNDRDNRNEQPAAGQNAKGSSNRGGQPSADQRNQGGGQDSQKRQNQSQPKGETDRYANGGLSRSSANDGGTIEDADNRDAK
ncbi:hypothetical protein [Hymenobacter sp. B81]|uniref:hypothetical protein n=1 Tax=Hymenobacter sp. B81 TaxID=3344878 RepID=UPI0037DDDFA7